jgi:site-specific DNA recombinase
VSTPIPDDELLAAELARLDRKIDAAEAERRRLVDIYQAGLVELTDLQRRAAEVAARLRDLRAKQASLAQHRATLARDNQLRHRVRDFAGRVRTIIDQLDNAQKQHLCRLLIEQVRVTGWHVEIRLRIPLDPEPGKPSTNHPHPSPLSSEDGLRSVGEHRRRLLPDETSPSPRRHTNQNQLINNEEWGHLPGHQRGPETGH